MLPGRAVPSVRSHRQLQLFIITMKFLAWLVRTEQKRHEGRPSATFIVPIACVMRVPVVLTTVLKQRTCLLLPSYDLLLNFERLGTQAMPESAPLPLEPVQPSLLSLLTFKRIGYAHLNVRTA